MEIQKLQKNSLKNKDIKYSETIAWLYEQLPMYQRVGKAAYKADLSNTILLADYLENPQHTFKSIHVAGTNGKGSTSHMIASILQEEGYKVGLYTSPHLKDFRERIKVNGKMISKQFVSSFIGKHQTFFESEQFSFFEMTVGMAFDYFRKERVDIAVIEVGLGGRLDSTNIINPEVAVITNIGMDHTQFLGSTLTEIATEKAGIIKPKIPVIIGEYTEETKQVFLNTSKRRQSPIYFAQDVNFEFWPSDLKGGYQKYNQFTTREAIKCLKVLGWSISEESVKIGLKNVIKNTGLLGRWQVLQENPKVICDTAHNREGLEMVMTQLREVPFKQLHLVLGMVSDKDLDDVLPIFPKTATYYFCKPKIARGLDEKVLEKKAKHYRLMGTSYLTVKKALKAAKMAASSEDVIYIGGSTFVVAEIL